MNRCRTLPANLYLPALRLPRFFAAVLMPLYVAAFTLSITAFTAPALQAQTTGRQAPSDVKFGHITVTHPPEIKLDGKPDRLSPGARIRNTNHMLLLSGSVAGKTLPVLYRRDAVGLVHEVWVLTADEAGKIENATSGKGGQALDDLLSLIFGARR
jgi:hypothetical protein